MALAISQAGRAPPARFLNQLLWVELRRFRSLPMLLTFLMGSAVIPLISAMILLFYLHPQLREISMIRNDKKKFEAVAAVIAALGQGSTARPSFHSFDRRSSQLVFPCGNDSSGPSAVLRCTAIGSCSAFRLSFQSKYVYSRNFHRSFDLCNNLSDRSILPFFSSLPLFKCCGDRHERWLCTGRLGLPCSRVFTHRYGKPGRLYSRSFRCWLSRCRVRYCIQSTRFRRIRSLVLPGSHRECFPS